MNKFIVCFVFFCIASNYCYSQNEVLLANGEKMYIKGKKVSSGQYEDQYLHETSDTLYYFQHDRSSQTVVEVRMPLRFFSKENSKKYKAEINFNSVNSLATFAASNLPSWQETPNKFYRLYHGYTQAPAMDDLHIRVGIRFDNQKEGSELVKRVRNRVKNIK
jgi:hypothetical protein